MLYFVGTLDGDARLAARIDPSVWAVARQPVIQSTARGRTLHAVQCQAVEAGVGFTYGCALQPPIWRVGQHDGLQQLQQRWAAALAPTLSGHRRGREEGQGSVGAVPVRVRREAPRALPLERAAQRLSQGEVHRASPAAWWRQLEGVLQRRRPEAGSSGAAVASTSSAGPAERQQAAVWGAVWRRLQHAAVPREHRFLAWRVLHGTLPCAAWLGYVGWRSSTAEEGVGEERAFCHVPECAAAHAAESLSHVFLECPAAAAVAAWLSRLWGAVVQGVGPPCESQVFLAGDYKVWDPGRGECGALWEIMRHAFLFFVWRARCACRRQGVATQPARIAAGVVAYLQHRMRQDFARTRGLEGTFASLSGHWLPRGRPMAVVDAVRRWCRNGVLARYVEEGAGRFEVRLSMGHPVLLPA